MHYFRRHDRQKKKKKKSKPTGMMQCKRKKIHIQNEVWIERLIQQEFTGFAYKPILEV